MFDTVICTETVERWAAWQTAAESEGGFGELAEAPGPDLAAELTRLEPIDVEDEELIERISAWEKLTA